MMAYEYKVVAAPKKPQRARGVKGTEARFAHTLEELMNTLGAEGWEYQRADTLPCETGNGLTGRTSSFQNVLVFRRAVAAIAETPKPVVRRVASQSAERSEPVLHRPEPEPQKTPVANSEDESSPKEVAAE